MMKSFFLLVILVAINNIAGEISIDNRNEVEKAFTIPTPRLCVTSKRNIYLSLIKRSNKNFISGYQTYMPKECNFSVDVVKIVEAYRNAANYVVIFLNKRDSTDEQFNEVVELYNSALNQFRESIRTLSLTRRLTNECYKSLMLMQRAITTTGEGLVAGTIITYNAKCPTNRVYNTFPHRPIQFVSNYLN